MNSGRRVRRTRHRGTSARRGGSTDPTDQQLSPTRTIAPPIGVGVGWGFVYALWLREKFHGPLWPPSEWWPNDVGYGLALVVVTICGLMVYGIAQPLRGDALERAQRRNRRTLLFILLLAIVLGWSFWAIAQPGHSRGVG